MDPDVPRGQVWASIGARHAETYAGTATMIVHITTREAWERARAEGAYRPDSLDLEGFIHASRPEQVAGVLRDFFPGRGDRVALHIEPDRLASELRWEIPPDRAEAFPHIYGPLNLDAVVKVVKVEDGSWPTS